jgi:NAD-reducing hydrogenase large subunit
VERDYFLDGKAIPNVDTMISWALEVLDFIKAYHSQHRSFMDQFASMPSGHLAMVSPEGDLELYHGLLRAIDAEGRITLNDVPTDQYLDHFSEHVERWSYMKFPYLKALGQERGWNRVGPLARLNVCDRIPTPLAERERQLFFAFCGAGVNHHTMHTHWARLIELLHCAELIKELLHDPDILGTDLVRQGTPRKEGIGILEAPRGTLIHHYEVDDNGMITRCNLIVSTTHNNQAMNRTVQTVAEDVISGQGTITEGMLNQVEVAIRAYDPCLSCATQALGKMPLQAELYGPGNELIKTVSTP